ncbi:alpha/beta hydrolase-fold protein [Shewanella sedimentimangrovi]|uniref:Esterase n=1 Tax=Shewanella sedimentimangrovi TaxID=2814293 RepID=A0ABX7R3M3_9GAMM|nr:alpha/beta hydrolase-fold protein [Shewanella sedimentimangrovi]QSX38416.1 hypothetical protein JYB85_06230 [Shewanella sedimentimangrovi]
MSLKNRLFNMLSTLVPVMVIGVVITGTSAIAAESQTAEVTYQSDIQHVTLDKLISLDIYAPKTSDTGRTYPTLYVMDGQHYFYNAVGFQKSLTHGVNVSPDYIVVGINTEKLIEAKLRDDWLEQTPEKMIELLERQVIPYVDQHFQTNDRRLYFGWQYGAIFGLKLFNARPTLMQGYLLASGQRYSDTAIQRRHAGANPERIGTASRPRQLFLLEPWQDGGTYP